MLKYLKQWSANNATINPFSISLAFFMAPYITAPDDIPAKSPSFARSSLAVFKASTSSTKMTSSISSGRKFQAEIPEGLAVLVVYCRVVKAERRLF